MRKIDGVRGIIMIMWLSHGFALLYTPNILIPIEMVYYYNCRWVKGWCQLEDHDHPNYIPYGDGLSLCQFKVGNDNHKIPIFARFVDQYNQKYNIDMDSPKEAEITEHPSRSYYEIQSSLKNWKLIFVRWAQ